MASTIRPLREWPRNMPLPPAAAIAGIMIHRPGATISAFSCATATSELERLHEDGGKEEDDEAQRGEDARDEVDTSRQGDFSDGFGFKGREPGMRRLRCALSMPAL